MVKEEKALVITCDTCEGQGKDGEPAGRSPDLPRDSRALQMPERERPLSLDSRCCTCLRHKKAADREPGDKVMLRMHGGHGQGLLLEQALMGGCAIGADSQLQVLRGGCLPQCPTRNSI